MELKELLSFYKGKKVLVTGHTGFKGTWLSEILILAGAKVVGFSMGPPTVPSLFQLMNMKDRMNSVIGDVRDLEALKKVFDTERPEIVFHLAAQPIVKRSYKEPVMTFETNVMGTVNICECVRTSDSVRSFLNVTTDKVYLNREWNWGYREEDPLDGFDPYSNSKSCSELVTHSYINSFFKELGIAVSTARAGNVIGGGDFAEDRIVPDSVRAGLERRNIEVRNPYSTRPYQHVLEPLTAYLMIARSQYENKEKAGYYNVGPDDRDCVTTGTLVSLFCKYWNEAARDDAEKIEWISKAVEGPHEAGFLKLDSSLIKAKIGWKPIWNIEDAIKNTVAWTKVYEQAICASDSNEDSVSKMLIEEMDREISEYYS